jgi:hypothetical protein
MKLHFAKRSVVLIFGRDDRDIIEGSLIMATVRYLYIIRKSVGTRASCGQVPGAALQALWAS